MNGAMETLVRAALLDCYDLDLPCNIVDLGLLLNIEVRDDREAPGAGIPGVPAPVRVEIRVTPSHPGDASEAHLRAQIANRIAGLPGVTDVVVRIVHEQAWTPAQISARGRRILGLAGNPSLVQIAPR